MDTFAIVPPPAEVLEVIRMYCNYAQIRHIEFPAPLRLDFIAMMSLYTQEGGGGADAVTSRIEATLLLSVLQRSMDSVFECLTYFAWYVWLMNTYPGHLMSHGDPEGEGHVIQLFGAIWRTIPPRDRTVWWTKEQAGTLWNLVFSKGMHSAQHFWESNIQYLGYAGQMTTILLDVVRFACTFERECWQLLTMPALRKKALEAMTMEHAVDALCANFPDSNARWEQVYHAEKSILKSLCESKVLAETRVGCLKSAIMKGVWRNTDDKNKEDMSFLIRQAVTIILQLPNSVPRCGVDGSFAWPDKRLFRILSQSTKCEGRVEDHVRMLNKETAQQMTTFMQPYEHKLYWGQHSRWYYDVYNEDRQGGALLEHQREYIFSNGHGHFPPAPDKQSGQNLLAHSK